MLPYHPIVRGLFAMIPHQFYYQLVVLGLLWLCVMLHLAWPSRDVTTQTKPAKPLTPRHQRSTELKPFAGLTHKPHCALCAQETGERLQRLRDGPILCPQRTAAPVLWTPQCTFAPTPSVTIAGGWG